ncbi:expressed unknown protein [Seminavis robusta]|uniref:TAZ-type domain-containing protein n=1 Tax=Seminavis robusta TaxID=568900 RepID=A0A9N8DZL5_9STRA|nr:expressed unknown protein [Seminavis robusta]|eukprot:Sro474_g150210.1 n/a (715) ;mRNA; r:18700-20844
MTLNSSKFVGIQFQNKVGTLLINAEKVIFRPKLSPSEKAANIKPVARSWRWIAIDRIEVLDPPRNSPSFRSLKLKSKVAAQKAVTLVIPTDVLDDVVEDMNKRLSKEAMGFEGSLSPQVQKKMAPVQLRRKSSGPILMQTIDEASLEDSSTVQKTSRKQAKSSRRASMPEITTAKKTPTKKEQDKKTEKGPTKPTQSAKGSTKTKKETQPEPVPAATEPATNKEEVLVQQAEEPTPQAERSLLSAVTAVTQRITEPIQKQVKTHTKFPLLKPPESHRHKEEEEDEETEDEIPAEAAAVTAAADEDDSSPNASTTNKSQTKRPLLHFLKPPPPRRNITDEFDEEMKKTLESQAKTSPTASNAGSNNIKSKAKQKEDKEQKKASQNPNAGNKSKAKAKDKTRKKLPPPETNNKPKAKAAQKDTAQQKPKSAPPEEQSDAVPSPRRSSMFATPPPQAKPKAATTNKKRTSWTPSSEMVYTPPPARKEKVQREVVFNPMENENSSSPQKEIVFTPTTEEKEKVKKVTTTVKLLDEDETSASTSSSEGQPVEKSDAKPESKISPTKSVEDEDDSAGVLWNPKAPEHVFRMMILQHAANCDCAKGSCFYDPTCSDYKRILAHIVVCGDGDECDFERCRATKQFLLTMQLMQDFKHDGPVEEAHKDFLVNVGAVAPIPVIQMPTNLRGGNSDGLSVVSDSTWWSNDWGEVEKDMDDDDDSS